MPIPKLIEGCGGGTSRTSISGKSENTSIYHPWKCIYEGACNLAKLPPLRKLLLSGVSFVVHVFREDANVEVESLLTSIPRTSCCNCSWKAWRCHEGSGSGVRIESLTAPPSRVVLSPVLMCSCFHFTGFNIASRDLWQPDRNHNTQIIDEMHITTTSTHNQKREDSTGHLVPYAAGCPHKKLETRHATVTVLVMMNALEAAARSC